MANQITEVRLLTVPLENDYKHTLYFSSRNAQTAYFQGKTVFYGTDFSYQRKDSIIRYPKHYDELLECNYVMYRNSSSSKWFYAFIIDKTYVNEERTDIHIETDVIQTYLFDYTVKPSFVEREHVINDTVGMHTVPENLECGEFVTTYYSNMSDLSNLTIVLGVTKVPDQTADTMLGGYYNGIYSGLGYFGFKYNEINDLYRLLFQYADEGISEAINCLFLAPDFLTPFPTDESGTKTGKSIVLSEGPGEKSYTINKSIIDAGSYTPRNNKLNCYPYKYLLVSNNNGASAVYQFEHFENEKMTFKAYGCLTPGCSIRLIPRNYKGILENNEEGLNLGKYPICSWTSDAYTNWLTQNSVNIGLTVAAGVGQMVAGGVMAVASLGTGALVGGGMIAGGASAVANQLAQIHQMSFTPPQAKGNTNCGDVTTSLDLNTFSFYGMSIKEEYMRIIDNFFDMYGYKCNRVKTPEKNHRENYWYTKTIDVSIDGAINNNDMQTIKNCYNNGITFWKNPSNIGNYSVSNDITPGIG